MVVNEKLFGCPYCGFRLAPGESRCGKCGNSFGPDTKLECPFCGDIVTPTVSECPTCHVNFTEFQTRVRKVAKKDSVDELLMEIIRLEATEVAREGKRLSCPNCDLLLNGSEAKCPRCSADLTEGAAFQCPVCGEFVAPEAMKCFACGSNFEVPKSVPQQELTAVSSALDDILDSIDNSQSSESPAPDAPDPEVAKEELPAPQSEPEQTVPPEVEPEPEPAPANGQEKNGNGQSGTSKVLKTRKLKVKTIRPPTIKNASQ